MEENAIAEGAKWYKAKEDERIGKKQWTSEEPVNPIYIGHWTLLHFAACAGNLPLVKFILEFEEGDKNPTDVNRGKYTSI